MSRADDLTCGQLVAARPGAKPPAGADHPLRRRRRRRGLTQVALAELSGLSGSFLSMVETGQRTLTRRDHINAVAAALRVSPAELAPSTIPGLDSWAPALPGSASAFPALRDEFTMTRHARLVRQFMAHVARGDTYEAGVWLRRTARDPSVSPWLLLDLPAAHDLGVPRSRSHPSRRSHGSGSRRDEHRAVQARGTP